MESLDPGRQVRLDADVAGPLFMLAAALLFTVLNLIIKLMNPAYTVWHIGFIRFAGGLLVLLSVFGRHTNPFSGDRILLLIARGIVGSIAFFALIASIRLLPLSTVIVIFYAYPAFAAVFAFLIFRESIGIFEVGCIAAVFSGVALLFDFKLGSGLAGQTLALGGSMVAGLSVVIIKTLRQSNGPVIIYLYFCLVGALITLPMCLSHPLWPASAREWAMIAGIVFTSVTAQLLMNQGFLYCRGWEGALFMSSETVFTAIVGIVFLNDPVSWRFWAGGLLVLGSALAMNRHRSGQIRSKP
ncbi:MAG: DMT family transporter [Pseudomonadota bacterium]